MLYPKKLRLTFYETIKFDALVKSQKTSVSVIPAQAGVTGLVTFYETIKFDDFLSDGLRSIPLALKTSEIHPKTGPSDCLWHEPKVFYA